MGNIGKKINIAMLVFYVLFGISVGLIILEVVNMDTNTTTIEETIPEKTTPEEVVPWDPVMPEETIIIISEDMQYVSC